MVRLIPRPYQQLNIRDPQLDPPPSCRTRQIVNYRTKRPSIPKTSLQPNRKMKVDLNVAHLAEKLFLVIYTRKRQSYKTLGFFEISYPFSNLFPNSRNLIATQWK
ncbi:unnamed protein product, partial [Nesidiocoris tenuis]